MIYNGLYNTKEIDKCYKRLNVPAEFWKPNYNQFFSNDYSIILSIRKDSGKTTNILILGLILNYLYETTIEYLRNDTSMITKSVVGSLFSVIENCGYLDKLYGLKCHLEYKSNERSFYLIDDETGERIKNKPICVCHSNEQFMNMKSSYVNPKGDFIVLDEFMDTNRMTGGISQEFINNISTIGRERPTCHVFMIGNNTDKYNFYFRDFCISDEVMKLDYGKNKRYITDLGTTIYIEMLPLTFERKKSIVDRSIRFWGFSNPKFSAFTGVTPWAGYNYPHLVDEYEILKTNLLFMKCDNNIYISFDLVKIPNRKPCLFAHFFNTPQKYDTITINQTPQYINEIRIEDLKVKYKYLHDMFICKNILFAFNDVGLAYDNYFKDNKLLNYMIRK